MRYPPRAESTYAGIDTFRIIAAILVVTVHTSPLLDLNETADFILTRVIARVAVPFFFMASGFFLFLAATGDRRDSPPAGRLITFLKRTAVLYGVSTLLYLPVAVYAGQTQAWWYIPGLLKAVLFDGTFYHLWYLPAAMLGATLVWFLRRALPAGWALAVCLLLYAIGLFGDSYYGLTQAVPAVTAWYGKLFAYFGYTRNGLFLVPVFFMFGALIARQQQRLPLRGALSGLGLSVVLLLAEGLLLHALGLQRHDSMYLMLLPAMVFLFQSLLHWQPRHLTGARPLALAVYIIHPLMILLVRGVASFANLRWLLIDHNLIHFLVVAAASFAAAIAYTKLPRAGETRPVAIQRCHMDRAWAEIDGDSLRHNVDALRRVLPEGCQLMAVVKANAYGHGDVAVAGWLEQAGVRSFAVATLDEGIQLRRSGIGGDILILGYTAPERIREVVDHDLIQTLLDGAYASRLNPGGKPIRVHIKINTGMHRLGEDWSRPDNVDRLLRSNHFKIEGIFTHLATADRLTPEDVAFTREQIQRFGQVLTHLQERHTQLPSIHLQSSYGLLNYPDLRADYARVGIALYGVLSSPESQTRLRVNLRPVLQLKARVALVRDIGAGEAVGYGRRFVAEHTTRIAVVPVGYADLYPRSLSPENSCVLIDGCRAPIVGRICMDQLMVDIGNLPHVQEGDLVTLIGRDGGEVISAEEVAAQAGTITNELLSRLGVRLERIYFDAGSKPV